MTPQKVVRRVSSSLEHHLQQHRSGENSSLAATHRQNLRVSRSPIGALREYAETLSPGINQKVSLSSFNERINFNIHLTTRISCSRERFPRLRYLVSRNSRPSRALRCNRLLTVRPALVRRSLFVSPRWNLFPSGIKFCSLTTVVTKIDTIIPVPTSLCTSSL